MDLYTVVFTAPLRTMYFEMHVKNGVCKDCSGYSITVEEPPLRCCSPGSHDVRCPAQPAEMKNVFTVCWDTGTGQRENPSLYFTKPINTSPQRETKPLQTKNSFICIPSHSHLLQAPFCAADVIYAINKHDLANKARSLSQPPHTSVNRSIMPSDAV